MVTTETIDGSGYPLVFRVRDGDRAATVAGRTPARDVFRVEARTMTGHQKELVVTEGESGPAWRMASDEGANLKGTDLAPFPLAFFNAGLQADYLNRLLSLARTERLPLEVESLRLDNRYHFSGSFLRGTGEGSAEPVAIEIGVRSAAPPAQVLALLEAALAASPAHALLATPLRDTFALYVNGRRCPVRRVAPSQAPDEADPFRAHRAPPRPLESGQAPRDLIERLSPDPDAGPARPLPGEGRIPILIGGSSILEDPAGVVAATVVPTSPGARFRFRCDEGPQPHQRAPSGLACAAAGIAFCYMTQLSRYIEYRHHRVRAIRLVQTLPFTLALDAGALRGAAEPADTHVFLHGEEPDEVMQTLLEVAENTCYLHAALRRRIPSRVLATLNGSPLAPA